MTLSETNPWTRLMFMSNAAYRVFRSRLSPDFGVLLAHGVSLQFYAIGVDNQPIENCLGERGIVNVGLGVPIGDGYLWRDKGGGSTATIFDDLQ